jgi:uncharacterized damage-inducible protein DinB
MRIQDLLGAQYTMAHQTLETIIADCDPTTLAAVGDGSTIGSIAAIYAHTVFTEDTLIANAAARDTLWAGQGWAEKTGVEMQPAQYEEWARTVNYDLATVRDYAKAVHQATHDYLANVTDDELSREIETMMGKMPAGQFVGTVVLWHVQSHQGEIAALLGTQGKKGLPF